MKKNILKILSALACIFLAFNASAQRPIWVVGHACNSQKCLADAIADGGNGVEIDINSNADSCRTAWSVNHDGGYLSLSVRNSKNDSQRRYGEYSDMRYVSLEEYLNFPDMLLCNVMLGLLLLQIKGLHLFFLLQAVLSELQ